MAPRKFTDEQLEEIRQMFETFTASLQTTLQTSMENALTTVLHAQREQRDAQGNQQQRQERPRNAQVDVSDDEELAENLFAAQGHDQRDRRGQHQDARHDDHDQRLHQRWETGFRSEIPEFLGTLNPEDFIDCTHMVEEILEFKQVPPEM